MIACNGSRHCRGIVSARLRKPKLVMRMPFADMEKPVFRKEPMPHMLKIADVLIEKSCLVICIRARADREQHDGDTASCPESEQFSSCFDIRTI